MRPRAQGGLLAALTAETAPRLLKKLDAEPTLAESWSWGEDAVVTPNGETVAWRLVDGVLQNLDDLTCSCLLAPRCLHRLAVLALLEPAGEAVEPAAEAVAPAPVEPVTLSPRQRQAARLLWEAGARVLEGGAESCGVVAQGELLRAAYACRETGLHRGGRAATRVCSAIRQLRADSVTFSLERLAADLEELLAVAFQLRRETVEPAWVGQARRAYAGVGNLKLWGLFCEPVLSAAGYAGAATTLVDGRGRFYTISDVAPGSVDRVRQAYAAGSTLPGLTLSHRALSRSCILVQNATASDEGRLGSGQGVLAALLGPSQWAEPEVARLWERPWSEQLQTGDLLFLEAEVLGAERDALIARGSGGALRLRGLLDHPELPGRENLGLLGRWLERPMRYIARLDPDQERTLTVLAVGGDFPEGTVNLGLDRLQAALLPGLHPRSPTLELSDEAPPLADLSRRLLRLARSGRAAASPDERQCRLWEERYLKGAARLWRALAATAGAGSRDLCGLWRPDRGPRLAELWLAGMRYQQSARRAWLAGAWGG